MIQCARIEFRTLADWVQVALKFLNLNNAKFESESMHQPTEISNQYFCMLDYLFSTLHLFVRIVRETNVKDALVELLSFLDKPSSTGTQFSLGEWIIRRP